VVIDPKAFVTHFNEPIHRLVASSASEKSADAKVFFRHAIQGEELMPGIYAAAKSDFAEWMVQAEIAPFSGVWSDIESAMDAGSATV
jgi:hypothetical protein